MGERIGLSPEEMGMEDKKKKEKKGKVGVVGRTLLAASLMMPAGSGLAQSQGKTRERIVNKTEQVNKTPEKKETEKHIIFVRTSAQGREAQDLRSNIEKALEDEGVSDAQIILELDGNANQFEKQAGVVKISWKTEVSGKAESPRETVGGVAGQTAKRTIADILGRASGGRVSSGSIGGVLGTNNSPTRVSEGRYSLRGELSNGRDSDVYSASFDVKAVSKSGSNWEYFLRNGKTEKSLGYGSDYQLSNDKLREMTTNGFFEQKGNKVLRDIAEKFKNSPASTKR